MKRQSSIRRVIRELERDRQTYDLPGALGVHGAYQERMLVEAALAAAQRLAGQPSTPPTMRKAA